MLESGLAEDWLKLLVCNPCQEPAADCVACGGWFHVEHQLPVAVADSGGEKQQHSCHSQQPTALLQLQHPKSVAYHTSVAD